MSAQLFSIKQMIEGLVFAIMGSMIFAYILDRDVRLVFPEKLVIRRRTSEGSEGQLTLGVLLGNPGKNGYMTYSAEYIVLM